MGGSRGDFKSRYVEGLKLSSGSQITHESFEFNLMLLGSLEKCMAM